MFVFKVPVAQLEVMVVPFFNQPTSPPSEAVPLVEAAVKLTVADDEDEVTVLAATVPIRPPQ